MCGGTEYGSAHSMEHRVSMLAEVATSWQIIYLFWGVCVNFYRQMSDKTRPASDARHCGAVISTIIQ